MPSLKSRLIYFFMRNRHLFRFHLEREIWDWNTSIPNFRQQCEEGAKRAGKLPVGIEVSPVTIESLPVGLSAEWIRPSALTSDRAGSKGIIFYIHGGGYVAGSCNDHRIFVTRIVQWSGVEALQFEYRLAPEHPYPAALEDTLATYRWLLNQGIYPSNIVMMGDSAGGGLALATLLALRDQEVPLPAAAVAVSPFTDLKLTGESHRTKAKVCLSPPGMSAVCAKYYTGEHDPTLPYISPLYGDLHRLPPILCYVGEYEVLLDDSTRFAAKAKESGVNVTIRIGEKMFHCYPLLAPLFPEASQAMDEISMFIKTHSVKSIRKE